MRRGRTSLTSSGLAVERRQASNDARFVGLHPVPEVCRRVTQEVLTVDKGKVGVRVSSG